MKKTNFSLTVLASLLTSTLLTSAIAVANPKQASANVKVSKTSKAEKQRYKLVATSVVEDDDAPERRNNMNLPNVSGEFGLSTLSSLSGFAIGGKYRIYKPFSPNMTLAGAFGASYERYSILGATMNLLPIQAHAECYFVTSPNFNLMAGIGLDYAILANIEGSGSSVSLSMYGIPIKFGAVFNSSNLTFGGGLELRPTSITISGVPYGSSGQTTKIYGTVGMSI